MRRAVNLKNKLYNRGLKRVLDAYIYMSTRRRTWAVSWGCVHGEWVCTRSRTFIPIETKLSPVFR